MSGLGILCFVSVIALAVWIFCILDGPDTDPEIPYEPSTGPSDPELEPRHMEEKSAL